MVTTTGDDGRPRVDDDGTTEAKAMSSDDQRRSPTDDSSPTTDGDDDGDGGDDERRRSTIKDGRRRTAAATKTTRSGDEQRTAAHPRRPPKAWRSGLGAVVGPPRRRLQQCPRPCPRREVAGAAGKVPRHARRAPPEPSRRIRASWAHGSLQANNGLDAERNNLCTLNTQTDARVVDAYMPLIGAPHHR